MYSDVCSTIPLLGLIKTLLALFWDSLHHQSYWVHIRKRKPSTKYIDSSAAGLLSFITSLQISNTTTLLQTFLRALSIGKAQYWHFANGEYLKLIPSFNFAGLFLGPHQLFCLHHHGTWSTGALLCSSFLLVLYPGSPTHFWKWVGATVCLYRGNFTLRPASAKICAQISKNAPKLDCSMYQEAPGRVS